ncbi:alpha-amylase family glycosyl hydrolase [Saccharibacillus qingshengii]|uniref:alpha-amylase family glycosyl hydrolase n=1 Tax=Saccharibacillus qingshengii TaxID=1763540 RepID=UPI0031B60994
MGQRKHEEAAELIRRNVRRGSRAAKAGLKAAAAPGGAWMKIRPLPAFAAALLLASLAAGCSGGGTSQPSGNGAEAGVSAPAAGSESAKPGGAAASGGAAGSSAGEAKTVSAEPDEQPGTVYYEIFVRSFYDSDGDGIGDLNGVTEKLDDLNDGDPSTSDDLGIGGIWLMPILESPSYHGYDVTDYDRVNPDYGTEADLQRLVDEAHKRGIKVIMDLVVNHTGSGHPWFKDSASGPGAAHRDWYVWAEDAGIEPSGQSAAGSGSPWHAKNGSHYMGTFWGEMPDLNFDNPEVRAEMIRIGRRWLDLGLDGFRLDAAKHIYEDRTEDRGPETTKKNVQWWQEFRSALQASNPDVYLVGEIWENSPAAVAPYLDNAFDSGFNFGLAEGLVGAAKSGHAGSAFSRLPDYYRLFGEASGGQFVDAGFLTNHDQDRVMTQLGGRLDAMKTAAAMLLTLPGNPFIYYGEEIGMLGAKPDEQIREPMLWAAPGEDPGQTTWEPLIANAKAADSRSGSGTSGGAAGSSAAAKPTGPDAGAATVAAQTGDPDSLLSRYRTLIRWRDEIPALGSGALEAYDPGDDRAAGWIRTSKGQRVLVLHNLSGEPLELAVSRPAEAAPAAPGGEAEFGRLLRATDPAAGLDPAGERLILPPHASAVLGR